ncbi:MAG TPA: hypothetical protein PLP29_17750 [Candidatus Ozemobacteraceae bacterium]|nr:hypothetical protein [Candidatus Ozemobacteraceae bacterium]
MLTAETSFMSRDGSRSARDLREENEIAVAAGWGESAADEVADIFVQFDHKGPVLTLTTSRGAKLTCSPDHPCCGRMNTVSRLNHLYLMERNALGFRVGLSTDLMKDLVSMQHLRHDLFHQQEIVDRLWIIESTENPAKAQFLLKYAMFKYGLPDVPFEPRPMEADLPDEMVHELYNRIDTPSRAHQLLLDWLMYEDSPHVTMRVAKAGQTASNAIQFVIFGGTERARGRPGYAHLIRIDNVQDPERAEHKQFRRRQTSHGQWYLEVTRDDDEEAQLFVKTLSALDNLEIVRKIQLTKKPAFYLLPASHLKIGMLVPTVGERGVIEEDSIVSIETTEHQGPLYDFKVRDGCTYIAGGWVTMAWSGSAVSPARKTGERQP